MNWKAFVAMQRDWRVARRNFGFLLVQTMLQPMLFVFVFGRVLTRSGFMPPEYKSLLLPGIIAIAMMFSGIMGVAMPLIGEFQYRREIEDRLLAPIAIEWVALEKIVAGALQALVSGLVVIPAAWLVMGSGVDISFHAPVIFLAFAALVSLLAASIGLALGCFISQTTIGLMFSLFVTPMIMFGSTYYPWSALAVYPAAGGARQPARLRQRRLPRGAGPAVSAPAALDRYDRPGDFCRRLPHRGPAIVPEKGDCLGSRYLSLARVAACET